jgi:hypothetical protein
MEVPNRPKKAHEYWYDFGCNDTPSQIREGHSPNPPYKRFITEKECQTSINQRKHEQSSRNTDNL